MSRSTQTAYLCDQCGADFPKWYGQCPACKEWGTLREYKPPARKNSARRHRSPAPPSALGQQSSSRRIPTRLAEVDRVLGGGLLPGALILLGGNPGIGKSTLALQILHRCGLPALYVSAEESADQLALRAQRLQIQTEKIFLSNEAEIQALEEIIRKEEPTLVVVDSIQTMYSENLDSLPGSVGQIRDCSQRLLQLAKALGTTILIIGHVTKEGILAGPRMLEHMVDTVLYLEGDERYDHRMLRSVKNRFGATHEIGVFRMSSAGLEEVTNPSRLFLQERLGDVSGTVIYPSLEGTRPILVEVQALVTPARFGTPQRTANGLDFRRVSMLLAVLEKRLQRPLGMRDVFVNIVGGLKIDDPAADLAVIAAIVSSEQDRPVPEGMVLVGEVGLGGEVRNVTRLEQRLREAQELGCTRALVPKRSSVKSRHFDRLQLHPVLTVQEALAQLFRDR